jgi:Spy/CpxP family protein refolding chaperone
MNIHPFRLAALAVAFVATGGSLSAQSGPGFMPGHGPAGGGPGLRSLDLSEAQRTKIKTIHDGHQATIKTKAEAAQTAHKAFFEAMRNMGTDASTLKTLHDKASAAQFDLMLEQRAIHQEILPFLTAEQKARFEKMPMGPHPGTRGRGWGHGHGMGPRPGGPGSGESGPENMDEPF